MRKTLEAVLETYSGERKGPQWDAFYTYARQVFFAYGIHHHYSHRKIVPAFTAAYLAELLQHSAAARLPLDGGTVAQLTQKLTPILLDPNVDPACTNVDPGIDNVAASANHFYVGVTAAEGHDVQE